MKITDAEIIAFVTEHPQAVAKEIGVPVARLNELRDAGKLKEAGVRATGQRGRPSTQWVLPEVEVATAVPALVVAIRDTASRFPACKCDLHEDMTLTDLRDLGGGCTMPSWACGRLTAIRRATENVREDVEVEDFPVLLLAA